MEQERKEELQWNIVKALEEISTKLDRVISLLEFSLRRESQTQIAKVLGRSELRREIYSLCDGKKTVKQIAQILEKSMPNISMQITGLEKAGIVKSRRVGKEKYYLKVIEL